MVPMTSAAPPSVNASPEEVAAARARLLAEAPPQGQKPPAARLCPTVRRLLESRQKGSHVSG
jgi:hypothetical protein